MDPINIWVNNELHHHRLQMLSQQNAWGNNTIKPFSYGLPVRLQIIGISTARLLTFIPFPPLPSVILYPTALLSVFCSYIPLFQSEKPKKLIKIPACKTVLAQERRPVSLTLAFTLFWGRAQAQRRRELQRSLMCTGLFWEWALRHDASTERDNRWQHLEPWNRPGLTIPLWVSLFSSSLSIRLFLSLLLSRTVAQYELLSHKDRGPIYVEFTCDSQDCVKFHPHIKDQAGQLKRPNCLKQYMGLFLYKITTWESQYRGEQWMNEWVMSLILRTCTV